ncbi:aminoglycoside phosphotransferase family protein [Mesobacillus subterraneus]|uniref:aminoglycoside phosphotransferase family protein n=1 Tax=Mesobacillus subterraneus TaxID=285983 RepID=UPI001CFE15C0|nr:aminoglycoside phosphotransferase family protein [Mesobacillus subterraneus]WLR56208.1 aminoglycoside phosphotransferase family protein [Mesobacillus subterraneus]
MNINIKRGGDDYFFNRLFSYLSSELEVEIKEMTQLRGNVYLVETVKTRFILKGYSDLRKLKIQQAFTSSLRKSGFDHSYRFYNQNKDPLQFHGSYYGLIEYIDHHEKRFDYGVHSDREKGVELLNGFHDHTSVLVPSYAGMLPKTDLPRKWTHRKNEFAKNLPRINYYVNKAITEELLEWADFSLANFVKLKGELENNAPTILHGDVAHHNFLRSKEGKLYLIDFDLISSGSPAFDMLQYANRILPFLDWQFESLKKINHLNKWLDSDAFLAGLLYPADILREWNRLLRNRTQTHPYSLAPIIEMTVGQFQQRKQFQEEVKSRLDY